MLYVYVCFPLNVYVYISTQFVPLLFTRGPVFLIVNIFSLVWNARTHWGMEYIIMPGKDVGNIWANIAGHAAFIYILSGGFLLPVLILFPAWLIRIRRINWTPPSMQCYKSLELNCEFKVSIRHTSLRSASHSYQPIFSFKKYL